MRKITQKWAFVLVTLLCLVGMSQMVMAQDCKVVGEGTTANAYYTPIANYYHHSYSQQLYLADELEMPAGNITSIAFAYTATSSTKRTISIYMANTDAENLSSSYVTEGFTEVLAAQEIEFSNSEEWTTIELETPFAYDGTSNLVVAVHMNYSSAETNYSGGYRFKQTSATGMARYTTNDTESADQLTVTNGVLTANTSTWSGVAGTSSNDRPNIQICYSGGSGTICAAPDALEFTGVTANSATVNITSDGGPYIIEYKKSSVSSWDDAEKVFNVTSDSYEFAGLESNTTYNVKVTRDCGKSKTANFTTLIALPYTEPFATTSAPSGWKKYTGVLNTDNSASLASASGYYHWSFGSSNGVFDSHAYIEVYNSQNQWLVSPFIPMKENQQLTFNLALTYYSGNDVPCSSRAAQPDARFVVLVSSDGSNWTPLREWNNTGSEYVYDNIECSAEGDEVEIDLSAYSSGNLMFGFYIYHSTGGDNKLHIDNFKIANAPTCLKPEDLHETANTKNSISVEWTPKSGESAWKLQYKKAADEDWTTVENITTDPSYEITGLEAYTAYNIRVAAVCAEDDVTEYGKIITVKTAAGVPFAQSFNASSIPSDWKRYEGSWENVENSEPLEAVSNGWTCQYKTTNGVFPDSSYHMVLNLKDTVYKWIVSPAIEMEDGYQLTFNLALTKASGTLQAVDAGKQNSQELYLAVSEDNGTSWNTLQTWTNSDSKFDGINASAAGQVVKQDLSNYAGKRILIAFYGQSQKDPNDANETGNNYLHIQNFKIDLIPSCENSGTLDVTAVAGSTASLQWDNVEGATWQYICRQKEATDYTPQEADWVNSTSERFVNLTGLSETTSYVFYLRRHCEGDNNNSDYRSVLFTTIQTPASIPFTDNFESSNKWLLINGTQTNAWAWGEAVNNGGTHALYVSNDEGASNAYTANSTSTSYVVKSFYFDEAGTYSVSFDWKANGESGYDYLRVVLAPMAAEPVAGTLYTDLSNTKTPAGWLALDGGSQLQGKSDWQHISVEIAIEEAGNYKVVLLWTNDSSGGTQSPAAIDNFSISKVNCSAPSGLALDDDPTASSASFAWTDDQDGNSWAYAYALASAEAPADAAYTNVDNNSVDIDGLAENSNYIFYLRKNCGANGYSESIQLPFKTLNPYQIIINDGTSTNTYVPIHGLYTDDHTRSQFIIPAATLEAIAWDTITNLTFYASSANISWEDHDWEIYMAEVASASFSSTSYVDWSSLIKVKNAGTLAVNGDKEMTITLDAPFVYKGGNLLIGFYQTTTDETYTSCSWYGVSATGASLSSYSSTAGLDGTPSQRNFLPKMAIDFKIGQAPQCSTPKGLVAVADSLKSDSAFIKWTEQGTASTWILRYRKSGAEKWDSLTVNIDSLWLEGLAPATTYEVQVASWCDPADAETITDFTGSIEFTTACKAISEFPFGENFDEISELPICWNKINTTTYSYAQGYPSVSSKALYFYSYYSSSYPNYAKDQYAILPEMEGISGLRIKFNARKYSSSYAADFVVGVMSDPEDESTFVGIDTLAPAYDSYESFKVSFAGYAGEGKHIAIMLKAAAPVGTSTYGYSGLYVDDITVEEIPACQEPEGLAIANGVDSITTTTARLAWTALNGETEWTIQYRKASETAWSSVVANTNPFELSGLTPSTIYYARVAAACTSENSAYSDSISFITECAAITVAELPYSQNFDEVSGLPLCWTKINTTTYSSYQGYPTVSGKELYFNSYMPTYSTSTNYDPQDQYAILPEMADINTLRIKFNARKYDSSYNADFVIGVMSDPADIATFVVLDSIKPASTTAADYEVRLNAAPATAKHIAIKMAASTGSYRAVYIDDVLVEEIPNCLEPVGVISVKDITDASATLFWDNEEGASWKWAYALASAEEPADDAFEAISDTVKVLEGLNENSTYVFYLRRDCESLMSPSISASFTTKLAPADPTNFSDDFEGAIAWQFINGTLTNAWVIDTAAHKDGEKAMYVSNDGGKHNKYTISSAAMVYATKLFNFAETGTYKVEFDWLAGGEGDSYPSDYMRVALIPDSIALVAGTSAPSGFSGSALPQAWNAKALDGGSKLNLKTSWQHSSSEVLVENAGLYKVVFAWRDDTSVGNDTAATVDNFSIEKLDCVKPTALTAHLTEGNGTIATLTWKKGNAEEAWVLNYSLKADLSDSIEVAATDTFVNLTGLTAEQTYYARVNAVCSETLSTDWTDVISFTPTSMISKTINKGSQTLEKVPFDGYNADYYNTVSQFIIPADSLTAMQWGEIQKLTFYAGTTTAALANDKFEVYVAPVEGTTLSALTSWSSLTKVMSAANLSLSNGKMEVNFDDPYLYQGGNLLIGFKETNIGSYARIYWEGVTATGASIGGTSESSASQQNFLPKMTITYEPGTEPSCLKPTGLALSNITADGVKATWNRGDGNAWQYAVALATAEEPTVFTDVTDTFAIVSSLSDNTDYLFYLRKNCGDVDGLSKSISTPFTTKQLPVAVPFSDDFEDGNKWVLDNDGQKNAWVLGEAVHNGEGSHALYISQDAGAANTYDGYSSALVAAHKSFTFEKGAYVFKYDWKCQGYEEYYWGDYYIEDYLRVALVPDSIDLSTTITGVYSSSLPAGWIAMDGGSALYDKTAWQTFESAELAIPAGAYKIVFVWQNETESYSSSRVAAAIDNFSITKVLCPAQTGVTIPAENITATSALVKWTAGNDEQSAWEVAYDTITSNQPDTLHQIVNATETQAQLDNLVAEHTYYVYVRAICDDTASVWTAAKSFTTASDCQTPDGLALVSAGLHSATINWNTYGQNEFNLIYGTDGVQWDTIRSVAVPYTFEEIFNPNTSYRVKVQAACEDENTWSAALTFKTLYGIPFEEKFSTTTVPADWSILSGKVADALSGTAPTATTGYWSFGTDHGVFDSHARRNIYGTSCMQWLVTPQVVVDGNVQLSFDLALTAYSSTTMEPQTTGTDDKFIVLISEDNGATWSVLRQWDNAGSEYVYNNIAATTAGEEVIIDLSSYNGKSIKVAFYGESTESNADNNLHIDNVLIDIIPTCAKPTGLTISEEKAHTAKIAWTAGEEGQDAWQIAYDTLSFNPVDTLPNLIDVNENPYVLENLEPAHTYYVYVRANCGTEDGVSKWTDVKSFTTTVACPAPTALEAVLTPGNGAIATLKWKAGQDENAWVLEYSVNADMSDAEVVNANDTMVELTGLTSDQKYYARVKADCGDVDGESLYSAIINFTPTDKYELLLNEGTTANQNVPIYGSYVGALTRSQFIIPAADLASIEWDSIQSLTFYGNFTISNRTSWGDAQFEAYVAEVEETTLSALAEWDALEKVMASASLGIEDGKMVVSFDESYQYMGGNLLIGFNQTVVGTYAGVNWYGVAAASGASMGGYGTSVSKQSFLPKMLIEYVPGIQPACLAPKGLNVVETAADKAVLAWKAVENATWKYAIVRKNAEELPQYISTTNDTVVVEDLLPQTDYIFYLRHDCGEEGNSDVVSIEFATDAFIAVVPFSDDFEGYNNWKFFNDETNGWVVGAATNNGGNQALYISNDGGTTHEYDFDAQTASFATLAIQLTEDTTYVVEYDWHAEGEYYDEDGALDYLRVGIVPAASEITAGIESLPAGWIALDGDTTLLEQSEWIHMTQEVALNAGEYKIVIAWFNDDADGNNPPAAIDNFSIAIKPGQGTGVDALHGDGVKAVKFIKDQKIYILINGVIYDVTGRKVGVR